MNEESGKSAGELMSVLPRPRQSPSGPLHSGHNICGEPRRKSSADHSSTYDSVLLIKAQRRVSCRRPLPKSRTQTKSPELSLTTAADPTPVIGDEPVVLIEHNRAGATLRTTSSNLNIRSRSKSSENQNLSNSPRKSRKRARDTKAIGAHPRKSSSSILNVELSNVALGNATQPSVYHSLDDLTRWDMESHTHVSNLSAGSGAPEISANMRSAIPNPFSTQLDDDNSFDDDMPFPFTRQSRVIREDMGVKKSKKKARGSLQTGSNILNRHSNIDLSPQDSLTNVQQSPPQPLPLQTLCQNSQGRRSLPTPPAVTSTKTKLPSPPKLPMGPSPSRKDSLGCTHLGAADCELFIAFPLSSHFEVWDMDDDSHIAIPALLCLMAKDAHAWAGMPLALPDVSFLDIRCNDVPVRVRRAAYDPSQEYFTQHQGPHNSSPGANAGPDTLPAIHTPTMSRDHITLERQWIRTYSRPALERNGDARILRRGEVAEAYTRAAGGAGFDAEARGWYIRFWIPIPTRLFAKRETRMFQLHARVWMMGDEKRALSLDRNADGRISPLTAEAQMTVSHLRAPREMDVDVHTQDRFISLNQ